MTASATAAIAAGPRVSRRRASASRQRRPRSSPRIQNRYDTTANSSAQPVQYSVNHAHGPVCPPKPLISEYDGCGAPA